MLDFRRATVSLLERRFPNHEMTRYAKSLGERGALGSPLATPMCQSFTFLNTWSTALYNVLHWAIVLHTDLPKNTLFYK